MPIAGIKEVSNVCVDDRTEPEGIKLRSAEWGHIQPTHPVHAGGAGRVDPLVIAVSGLEPGATLQFLNTSDPKVTWKNGKPKDYALPLKDLGKDQVLIFSDATAKKLGLEFGCTFEMRLVDKKGNAGPACKVELANDGKTITTTYAVPAGTQLGDATISMPTYRTDRYGSTSNHYSFVRYVDSTPPVVHAEDIFVAYDGKSKTVKMFGKEAVEDKATVHLKNLATQETFDAKVEGKKFEKDGINLKPGHPYEIWVTDRHNVKKALGTGTFEPDCGNHGGQGDQGDQGVAG